MFLCAVFMKRIAKDDSAFKSVCLFLFVEIFDRFGLNLVSARYLEILLVEVIFHAYLFSPASFSVGTRVFPEANGRGQKF